MPVFNRTLPRYILVGGTSYGFEMAVLYSLRFGLRMSSFTAVAISFWAGFVCAFVLQKIVTFKNYENDVRTITHQVIKYGLLTAWNYAFTLGIVHLFDELASVFVLRTLSIVIITSWNFIIYQKLFGRQLPILG